VRNDPLFTLVIPAHNEAKCLRNTVETHRTYLEGQGVPFEILIVDDGSTDETAAIASDSASRMTQVRVVTISPQRGKGAAVYAGVKAARGDVIGFTDADLAYPPSDILAARSVIVEGDADVVIGARDLPESRCASQYPLSRRLAGRLFGYVVRALVFRNAIDAQCGLKVFSRDAALALFPRLSVFDFAFDVEVLALAMKLGLRIRRVPVHFSHSRESQVRLLHDSAAMFLDVLRIRRRTRHLDASGDFGLVSLFDHTACILCGAERYDARVVLSRSGRDVLRCGRCSMEYLSPRLTQEVSQLLYSEEYFTTGSIDKGYDSYVSEKDAIRETLRHRLGLVRQHVATGKLLDAGCALGYMLELAQEAGFEPYGLDISDFACSEVKQKGFNAQRGSLEKTDFPDGFFDAVVVNDLLEHVERPVQALTEAGRILSDRGVALITTPNVKSILRRVSGSRWVSFKLPEHVGYFSRQTLLSSISQAGLEVLSIQSSRQMCSVRFLCSRLSALNPLAAGLLKAAADALGLLGNKVWVRSGCLTVLVRKASRSGVSDGPVS